MSNIDLLSNAIKQIYETRGDEAFSNSRLFHALLDDMVPTLTNERRIFRMAIDDSLLKQLSFAFNDDESNKQYEAIRLKRLIEDNNGLSEKWSEFIIGSFTTAAGIKLKIFSVDNIQPKECKNKFVGENEYQQEQKIILSDGCTYEGNMTNGVPNGVGKKIWPDGAVYVGDFVEGIKQGYGAFVFPDKRVYEGQFNDDKINGNGKLSTPDGKVYEGEFLEGKRTGKGRLMWPNGDLYEGEFVNGAREGKGKFIWSNGDTYEGDFVNGKMTGNGILIKNGIKQTGYFENGIYKGSETSINIQINNNEAENIKQKKSLIEEKDLLTKELKSLSIFDVKKKMDIKKQIADIDLKLGVIGAEETLSYLEEVEKGTSRKIRILKVDDKFSIKGRGTVIVGKLLCEKLYTGDTVIVNDQPYPVTAIEMYKKILKFAELGDYISILVRGLDSRDIYKGDYIYKEMK